MPLMYTVLHALTGLLCEETRWVSVALMEMSMEISTCSLMSTRQNKYLGNRDGNAVFEKEWTTISEPPFFVVFSSALFFFFSSSSHTILYFQV